jgi:PEP-CTERM motif
MTKGIMLSLATVGLLSALSPALADEVSLSSIVNADLNTYTDGSAYPMGGQVTIGGINFGLTTINGGDTGVAQLNANPSDPGGVQSFTLSNLSLSNVGTVYTIANSSFGAAGHTAGEITFNATGGLSYTYVYTEGNNIRDHANTDFNDGAPNVFAAQAFGNDQLDVQQIVLPTGFDTATITSINFNYVGDNAPGDGEAFLAAITTEGFTAAVPEPSTWAMMILGFCGLGFMAYRRKQNGTALSVAA